MKRRILEELSAFRTVAFVTFGVGAPLMIGWLLLPFLNYLIIILSIGWIPYLIWQALCYYYKCKDNIVEERRQL